MGQRGETAARADRSFLRNDRRDAAVEHRDQSFDHEWTRATETGCEHVRTQQQHRTCFGFRKWFAQTARMTPHQVQLQLAQVSFIDTDVGKFSETGVDAIDRAVLRNNLFHDTPRFFDALARVSGERDPCFTRSYICDLLKCKLLTVKLKHVSLPIFDCRLMILTQNDPGNRQSEIENRQCLTVRLRLACPESQ